MDKVLTLVWGLFPHLGFSAWMVGEGFKEEVATTCVYQRGGEPGSAPIIDLWKMASLSG